MRVLHRSLTYLEAFSRKVEMVSAILLALITLLVLASAIGRYLFAWPIPDAFDFSRLFLGVVIMWGFACVGYRGSHIKVDLFALMLPARVRRWTDFFAWLVLLGFTGLLCWKMLARVTSAYNSGETTFDLQVPVWPVMGLIWLGVAVSMLTILARALMIALTNAGLDDFEPAESEPHIASDPQKQKQTGGSGGSDD
ncbi:MULTISPECIES: TRAP transporter small permease [unclassified Thalassospira]|uniref:TRAP transporter small permease n=1 Tax=unclassified Thalassospira TaxID=2648997 RepID=UPI000EC652C8|nr:MULTISPECIES: TRAP transporter small permease [unclassified Thalassospira]MBO6808258.1 TRAP transporter small permease [Thalassospira sp.]MBO6839369.1 TRAP transporter small permease [Thalassospira sp.]HAI28694.1 TRAP transporter small permease [Thalassospira sp.]|tara:strand:+ start:30852 stop:31439 length:588 start_codon:yes stop_codon:yes gene_type:complete